MKKILLICIAITIAACQTDDLDTETGITLENNDFLLFGVFAGECTGDCVDIYRLTAVELMIDTTNSYPFNTGFYAGSYQPLSQFKYDAVVDLLEDFPTMLLEQDNASVFGCPDCVDQGGFYVEIRKGVIHKKFYMDTVIGNNPLFLQVFVDRMGDKIDFLNP